MPASQNRLKESEENISKPVWTYSLIFIVLLQTDSHVTMGQRHCLTVTSEQPPVWTGVYSGFFPYFEVSFYILLVAHCEFLGQNKTYVPWVLLG